jgi:hypothetical protein
VKSSEVFNQLLSYVRGLRVSYAIHSKKHIRDMTNLKYGVLRSLFIILVLCARNEVDCNKLDSKRRLPSRRRGPRPPSDQYGNERPLDDYRGSSDDIREFNTDDSRGYSTVDRRSFQGREYDENGLDDESTPVTSMPEDLVQQYTSKISSAITVSICSGEI